MLTRLSFILLPRTHLYKPQSQENTIFVFCQTRRQAVCWHGPCLRSVPIKVISEVIDGMEHKAGELIGCIQVPHWPSLCWYLLELLHTNPQQRPILLQLYFIKFYPVILFPSTFAKLYFIMLQIAVNAGT